MDEQIQAPKVKKWSDKAHVNKYYREYYHKTKEIKNAYTGWTRDPEKVKEYARNYSKTRGQELIECEVCKMELKRVNMSYHKKSKVHQQCLRVQHLDI
jgi:hypothetical protein